MSPEKRPALKQLWTDFARKYPVDGVLVTLIIVLIAVGAIYYTTTFRKMPPILKRGIQPSDFPQLIGVLILILTALMQWFDPARLTGKIGRMSWITLVAMGGFVLLLPLDMFLALGIFSAALCWLWKERRPWMIALVGIVVPALVFLLFDQVFSIRFERGLLTSLWYG